MKLLAYGPNAWLLRFADALGDEAFFRGRSIARELERQPPLGLIEYVFGFASVLMEFDPGQPEVEEVVLPEFLARLKLETLVKVSDSPIRQIPVRYDGPDLQRVAEHNEMTVEEVIQIHASSTYRVYLLGFTPGFPYLGDLDPCLHTPRLSVPRPRVAAGSVAIGGQHTGIYSVESPGGWNIIGHTSVSLFDPTPNGEDDIARRMFFLQPGDRVHFVPMVKAQY